MSEAEGRTRVQAGQLEGRSDMEPAWGQLSLVVTVPRIPQPLTAWSTKLDETLRAGGRSPGASDPSTIPVAACRCWGPGDPETLPPNHGRDVPAFIPASAR